MKIQDEDIIEQLIEAGKLCDNGLCYYKNDDISVEPEIFRANHYEADCHHHVCTTYEVCEEDERPADATYICLAYNARLSIEALYREYIRLKNEINPSCPSADPHKAA